MNEFLVALYALIIAEAGTTTAMMLFAPNAFRVAGLTEVETMIAPHAGAVVLLWVLIAGGTRLILPALWRPRRERSKKLNFLAWCGVICLLIDSAVTTYLYLQQVSLGTPAVDEPSFAILGLALLFRGAFIISLFALAVFVQRMVRRRRLAPPPPRRKLRRG